MVFWYFEEEKNFWDFRPEKSHSTRPKASAWYNECVRACRNGSGCIKRPQKTLLGWSGAILESFEHLFFPAQTRPLGGSFGQISIQNGGFYSQIWPIGIQRYPFRGFSTRKNHQDVFTMLFRDFEAEKICRDFWPQNLILPDPKVYFSMKKPLFSRLEKLVSEFLSIYVGGVPKFRCHPVRFRETLIEKW